VRKRVQLLAQLLWTRALSADADAVRLLLNPLPPQAIPPPEPEPQHKISSDPYQDVIVVLKALVEANVVPASISRFSSRMNNIHPFSKSSCVYSRGDRMSITVMKIAGDELDRIAQQIRQTEGVNN
jgi:hypothetical protein